MYWYIQRNHFTNINVLEANIDDSFLLLIYKKFRFISSERLSEIEW